MTIDGIHIRNYRSFDSDGVKIKAFGKVNVFIGKNNSGKSNVLRFISNLHTLFDGSNKPKFADEDYFQLDKNNQISFGVEYERGKTLSFETTHPLFKPYFENVNEIWLEFIKHTSENFIPYENRIQWLKESFPNSSALQQVMLKVFSQSSGSEDENLKQIFRSFTQQLIPNSKEVYSIGAFRKIYKYQINLPKDEVYGLEIFNGADLIEKLSELIDPPAKKQNERKKFDKIQSFLKEILDVKDMTIEISSGHEKELSLRSHDLKIPLDNLGTGIHQ